MPKQTHGQPQLLAGFSDLENEFLFYSWNATTTQELGASQIVISYWSIVGQFDKDTSPAAVCHRPEAVVSFVLFLSAIMCDGEGGPQVVQAIVKSQVPLLLLAIRLILLTSMVRAAPPLAGVDLGPCHDRRYHNPDYINPCASQWNPAGSLNNGNCQLQSTPIHGAGFSVCPYCLQDIATHAWWLQARARMVKPPPFALPTAANFATTLETGAWRGFLTRMCRLCERREQYLYHQRTAAVGLMPIAAPANIDNMMQYPRSTCTCLAVLERHRLCIRHRRNRWDTDRPQLLAARTMRMNWLTNTALTRHGQGGPAGVLATAGPNKIFRRNTVRTYRACRCGAEVVRTPSPPEVYFCMGCNGTVQVTAMPLPLTPATAQEQRNSHTHPQDFVVPRPRSGRVVD